jgi:hypothetical protein
MLEHAQRLKPKDRAKAGGGADANPTPSPAGQFPRNPAALRNPLSRLVAVPGWTEVIHSKWGQSSCVLFSPASSDGRRPSMLPYSTPRWFARRRPRLAATPWPFGSPSALRKPGVGNGPDSRRADLPPSDLT